MESRFWWQLRRKVRTKENLATSFTSTSPRTSSSIITTPIVKASQFLDFTQKMLYPSTIATTSCILNWFTPSESILMELDRSLKSCKSFLTITRHRKKSIQIGGRCFASLKAILIICLWAHALCLVWNPWRAPSTARVTQPIATTGFPTSVAEQTFARRCKMFLDSLRK